MADITCEVIRDLMPLYVDDVLSSDSKALVEEHLETCEGCTDYYHALKEPEGNYKQMKKADEKAAFKKIKGTLKRKRLLTILVTAVCIAALGFGLFYGLVVHEKYISYEESGLYVSEEAIRTDRNYYKSTGFYSPDGETLFLYMTTTAYTQMRNDTSMAGVPIISLDRAARTSTIEDDNGTVTQQVCKEVYYVPEKTAKQYMRAMKWTNECVTDEEIQKNREQEVEALKNASVLLWRESEE
jgi:hypothetical protein